MQNQSIISQDFKESRFLQNTILNNCLNALAIMSINKNLVQDIDNFDNIKVNVYEKQKGDIHFQEVIGFNQSTFRFR